MANDVQRQLSDLTYVSAGAVSSLDIPRDSVLKGLGLALVLDQTSAAVAASGSESSAGMLDFIRRIEVVADGALTLWSIDPFSLFILNALWSQAWPVRTDLAPPGAGTSNSLHGYLYLPFALPAAKDPNVTLLNAQALSSLQIRVTWGAVSDLYQTVANTTIDTTSLVSVTTHEVVGLSPRSIFSAFKVTQITRDITAANSEMQLELPRGNVLRGLLFHTRRTVNSVRLAVDTILNAVRLESSELNRGLFIHRRVRGTEVDGTGIPLSGYHMRGLARWQYGVNDQLITLAAGQSPVAGDSLLTGFYPMELMGDGRTSSALRTQPYSSLSAICNVSAPANSPQLVATVQEIVPAAPPRA